MRFDEDSRFVPVAAGKPTRGFVVGRCRLIGSKPALKACLVSTFEPKM